MIVALAQKKIDKEVEVNFDEGTGAVIATISSSDHTFFNNTAMVNGIWDFFVPMAKEAFTYEGVNQIKVVITGEFIDQYGKSEVGNAVYVDMTKTDFEMFNWDNLKFTNPRNNTELLTKSNFYVHPAIYKDIDPEKLKLSFL
jgi:hypothetical protein